MAAEIEITLDETGVPLKYLVLTKEEIPVLVAEYVSAIETQETNRWCRCEWIIHPEDIEVQDNHCRACGEKRTANVHSLLEIGSHQFLGKRMRRGDQNPECPVHTKEGFLLYFFEWVFTRERN